MRTETGTISVDPNVQAGTPCFAGTRVPVRALFEAVSHGRSTAYFLEQFPSVRGDQVTAVLDRAAQLLCTDATVVAT